MLASFMLCWGVGRLRVRLSLSIVTVEKFANCFKDRKREAIHIATLSKFYSDWSEDRERSRALMSHCISVITRLRSRKQRNFVSINEIERSTTLDWTFAQFRARLRLVRDIRGSSSRPLYFRSWSPARKTAKLPEQHRRNSRQWNFYGFSFVFIFARRSESLLTQEHEWIDRFLVKQSSRNWSTGDRDSSD